MMRVLHKLAKSEHSTARAAVSLCLAKLDGASELQKVLARRRQPTVPANFAWATDGKLAGMRMPASAEELLSIIQMFQVNVIVSLTEHPLDYPLPPELDCTRVHIPVTDFGTPRIDQALHFVKTVKEMLAQGKRVAAHCHAGAGRTGTMLGCYLVTEGGLSASEAVQSLRKQGRVLSNRQQEEFVSKFADEYAQKQ